jgi:ribosomal protein S18 acetylase RimI-like enzyme
MGVLVRRAAMEDAPQLMLLEAMLFENSMTEEMVERELRAGEGFVACQFNDPTAPVLGYVLVREDKDLLDITRLGVLPEAQCLGIGTALLRRILDMKRTTVLTVKKDNPRALRLYKRHGFKVVGHFVLEHAWVLRRDVQASVHPST